VRLIAALQQRELTGTVYIGYPIIGSADEPVIIGALLTIREHGVVVFEFAGEVCGYNRR
jgi:hypothetical protein